MTSTNKILTVSYGTFSCTLEGFDDAFGTMKAIAEYFRDLAAEDRYFGAEPPTPDTEMLARIAEREISRRVEAQVRDDGVHLRAAAALPAALATAEAQVVHKPAAEQQPEAAHHEPPQPTAPRPAAAPESPAAFAQSMDDGEEEDLATVSEYEDEPPIADTESVAAKLRRIRSVVSSAPSDDSDAFTEDEHAESVAPAKAGTAMDFEDAEEVEEAETEPEVASPPADMAETISAVMDETMASTGAEDAQVPSDEPEEMQAEEGFEDEVATQAEEVEAEQAPIETHVMKVGRDSYEDAMAQSASSEDALTPEAEADLAEALEEAEDAGMAADHDQDAAVESAEETAEAHSEGADALRNRDVDDDREVSRLLDKTDDELSEPESRQRRNAISHLRAAVQATRDDEELGKHDDTTESSQAYRNDLAAVVRPRRPVAGSGTSERPVETARPAPLKLVAEQRVDKPSDGTGPSVRPRRVATADLHEQEEVTELDADSSFSEFAEQMGARELGELLEAAAAYLSFVEGLDNFSRPQLMSKVRQVDADSHSREDRLRSFGVLLREGKIRQTRGGLFTASERISYKPADRAAG